MIIEREGYILLFWKGERVKGDGRVHLGVIRDEWCWGIQIVDVCIRLFVDEGTGAY